MPLKTRISVKALGPLVSNAAKHAGSNRNSPQDQRRLHHLLQKALVLPHDPLHRLGQHNSIHEGLRRLVMLLRWQCTASVATHPEVALEDPAEHLQRTHRPIVPQILHYMHYRLNSLVHSNARSGGIPIASFGGHAAREEA